VLLKDIVDLAELKFDATTRRPQTEGVKRKISDVDKRALEAAIQLKDKGGGELMALSMGDERTKTSMLEALAMGADSAYIVSDRAIVGLDTLATSLVLAAAVRKIGAFDLILCGEMTLDSLSSQIGPRLAELLDLPQVSYVKRLELLNGKLRAEREFEDTEEVVEVALPAVVSVVREVDEPRIPSLMNIMKAKKKPVIGWDAASLGLSADEVRAASSVEVLKVEAPVVERKHIIIKGDTVDEIVDKLAKALLAEGILEE
jgi:electron transfer flavoprotein beta subunit